MQHNAEISAGISKSRQATGNRLALDCEQSLFFFRFSPESNARARERRSREKRETRAATREEKRAFFVPLPSRAISHARGHLRVSRFVRRTTEKRETARSLGWPSFVYWLISTFRKVGGLNFFCFQAETCLHVGKN